MNIAVFELFPCFLRAKQNKIKGLKKTRKQGTNTRRQAEPYEQWIFEGVEGSKCWLLRSVTLPEREHKNSLMRRFL